MTKAEQRSITLSVAKLQLRKQGKAIDPFTPFPCVLDALDRLSCSEPHTIVSQWYKQANTQ